MADVINDMRGGLSVRANAQGGSTRADNASKAMDLTQYVWAENYDGSYIPQNALNSPVPKLILTEFQPRESFKWEKISSGVADAIAAGLTSDSWLGIVLGEIAASNLRKKAFNSYAGDPKALLSGPSMDFTRNLFTGKYLNVYEIPFFSNAFLKCGEKDGWRDGSERKTLGDKADAIRNNTQIDFPVTPVWEKKDTKNDWETEFKLINNTTDALVKNLTFLSAFAAGSYWVQMGWMQQMPNVYDVVCPGRFHQYFVGLDITVTTLGKNRTNPAGAAVLNLDGSADALFPDAYNVKVISRDLSPNNFNVFAESFNGFKKVSVGDSKNRSLLGY